MSKLKLVFVPDHSIDGLVTVYEESARLLILHNEARTDVRFVDNHNDADIVVVFEEWSFKQADYIKQLRASPLFMAAAPKMYTINYDDVGQGFVPGCYTSLRRENFDRRYHRACAYPYTYNEFAVNDGERVSPKFLYSFRGTSGSHPIRKKMIASLSGHGQSAVSDVDQKFHTHEVDQKKKYVEEILSSKFVLCPRGCSPSTYRLFETMSLGRCPVIVSDEWVAPSGIDWSSCSIKVSEKDVNSIPEILSGYSDRWEELGDEALNVWRLNFSESARYRRYLDDVIDLYDSHEHLRNSGLNTAQWHLKRMSSWGFRWQNGWTLPQKAFRRLRSAH